MAVTLSPAPWFQFLDANGNPYAGAKLFTYAAGSTTKLTTYQDSAGSTPHSNPIVLDSAGRATVYLQAAAYKFVLAPSTDSDPPVAPYKTQDNISAVPSTTVDLDVIATAGEALTAGQVVFLSKGDGGRTAGRWYLADADQTYSSSTAEFIGIVPNDIASGATGTVRVQGRATGLSGLTAGSVYYVSATGGALTTTAPANSRFVGVADSTTSLVMAPNPAPGIRVSGTPVDNQVAVWTSATAVEGDTDLIFDGTKLYVGDTTNAGQTQGLTLNQAGADDEILALKSSDVAHGITGLTETDTYGFMRKFDGANAGLAVFGLSTSDVGQSLEGIVTSAATGKTTAANAAVKIQGRLKSGTGVASLGANANILAVTDNSTTRFILDADGDSHQDVGTAWTNFDAHDDTALLHMLAAHVSRADDPLRVGLAQWLEQQRDPLERLRLVQFNPDGHHFVNMSRLTMLLVGAARQQDARLARLEARLLTLEAGRA